jgi:hypothetical protein
MQSFGVKKLVISFEANNKDHSLILLDEYAKLVE